MRQFALVCAALTIVTTLDAIVMGSLTEGMPCHGPISFVLGLIATACGGTLLALCGALVVDGLHGRGLRRIRVGCL